MEYMNTRQGLSAIAVLMLFVACSGGSAPRASQPEPTTATLSAPAGKRSALTPLSGRIVFDNHQDVWSINANGTDLIRLTHSPAFEFDPSWSPDGTQIAYRSDRGDESEIWVMNANGTGQRRLTAGLSPGLQVRGRAHPVMFAFSAAAGDTPRYTSTGPAFSF